MKVPTALYFLQNITNSPLPVISTEDIECAFQNVAPNRLSDDISDVFTWTKINTPPICNAVYQNSKTPPCFNPFRASQIFRTPCLPGLLNLNLSRPVTPITPAQWKNVDINTLVTPCLSQPSAKFNHDSFVIATPMIISSLTSLYRPSKCSGPDILQLIDDDSNDINCIDRKIVGYSDVHLDDHNVVDYLLNLSENPVPYDPLKAQQEVEVKIIIKRRKGRHAKRMTDEESMGYRERRKQREKERKKERLASFSNEEKGITRKSKRSRNNRFSYK